MKNTFTHSREKSRQPADDEWPEDIFRRDAIAPSKSSSVASDGDLLPGSIRSSRHASETSRETVRDCPTQDRRAKTIAVDIPEGLEPGRKVDVRFGPHGKKIRTTIPPRSGWRFEEANGDRGPRRYFYLAVDPNLVVDPGVSSIPRPPRLGAHKSISERIPSCAEETDEMPQSSGQPKRKCQCVLSLGVFDSICPYHGTPPHRS